MAAGVDRHLATKSFLGAGIYIAASILNSWDGALGWKEQLTVFIGVEALCATIGMGLDRLRQHLLTREGRQ